MICHHGGLSRHDCFLIALPFLHLRAVVRRLLLRRLIVPAEVSRSRSRFFQDQLPLLLYTGRAHFFFRHKLRGARHVVLAAPPDGDGYADLVAMLDEQAQAGERTSSLCLFTKFDQFGLERALGAEAACDMVTGPKAAYLYA